MEQITYPVSTNYRKEWGEWEAIREIVQNAIDSDCEAKMNYDPTTRELKVSDRGCGFEPKHLLIGESEKDGENSIGKFGEGLKFALLVLMRNGNHVSIKSNGKKYFLGTEDMMGVPVMSISYADTLAPIQGTEVTISDISKDYSNRFLSFDKSECFAQRHIPENRNLYIKGIFVKELEDSLFGYNLNMERENPISGDVSHSDIEYRIAKYIQHTNDREYMKKLILNAGNSPEGKSILENKCGSSARWYWIFGHREIWEEVIEEVYGPLDKLCLRTSNASAAQAGYLNFAVLEFEANFMVSLIQTDVEAVFKHNDHGYTICDESNLNSDQKETLSLVRLFNDCNGSKIKSSDIFPVIFGSGDVRGKALMGEKKILLSVDTLKYLSQALSVYAHEQVHLEYNAPDASTAFTNGLENLVGQYLAYMINRASPLRDEMGSVSG